ncbi:Leucine aminopeptidase 1 [Chytridiales sp. JEL 0842]|nr:Leucine aminopeptidase 1 [Chytridiales sp. JEL 0842]
MHVLKFTAAALFALSASTTVSALRDPPSILQSRHEADTARATVAAIKGPPAPIAIPAERRGGGSGKPEPNANPAADDCASGSTVVFETLRVLVDSGFVPEKVESSALTKLQKPTPKIRRKSSPISTLIIKAATSKGSTAFLRNVVKAYAGLLQGESKCEYARIDNSVWYNHGYETTMAAESLFENSFPYNDQVNRDGSLLDTLDVVDWDHITAFAKNTVGYVVELSLAGSGRANGRR